MHLSSFPPPPPPPSVLSPYHQILGWFSSKWHHTHKSQYLHLTKNKFSLSLSLSLSLSSLFLPVCLPVSFFLVLPLSLSLSLPLPPSPSLSLSLPPRVCLVYIHTHTFIFAYIYIHIHSSHTTTTQSSLRCSGLWSCGWVSPWEASLWVAPSSLSSSLCGPTSQSASSCWWKASLPSCTLFVCTGWSFNPSSTRVKVTTSSPSALMRFTRCKLLKRPRKMIPMEHWHWRTS